MKVTLDLTKEEIERVIDDFNWIFNEWDSPAFCGGYTYLPEEQENIDSDISVKTMLKVGNQLYEYIKDD